MIPFEMMMKDEVVKMNLDLLNEFMKYAFDHPDVLDDIPADAELVILPTNNPVLYNENKKTVDYLLKEGKNQKQYCRKLNYCQPEEESLLREKLSKEYGGITNCVLTKNWMCP